MDRYNDADDTNYSSNEMFTDSLELLEVLQIRPRFEAREEVGIGKKSDTRKLGKLRRNGGQNPNQTSDRTRKRRVSVVQSPIRSSSAFSVPYYSLKSQIIELEARMNIVKTVKTVFIKFQKKNVVYRSTRYFMVMVIPEKMISKSYLI